MHKFIVFDLDGTLIDTLPGLKDAINLTMKDLGYKKEFSLEEVKTFIGRGAKNFLKDALNREIKDDEYSLFLKNYEKTQYISKPFLHISEFLKKCNFLGIGIIIYSNKPDKILKKLVNRVFDDIKFIAIQGKDDNYEVKPDVTLLKRILRENNLNYEEGLYVGDSIVDIQTANNINMKCFILTYGYGNKIEMNKESNKIYINDIFEVEKYL